MKLDLTKMPVFEMIVGFLVVALVVTFVGAFMATSGDSKEGLVSAPPTTTSGATPSGSPPSGGQSVHLKDNKFEPDKLAVATGATVTFEITNDGKSIHNMHIAAAGGNFSEDTCKGGGDPCSDPAAVKGGRTAKLQWTAPGSSGVYPFRCDFHPDQMKGEITVQQGATSSGPRALSF